MIKKSFSLRVLVISFLLLALPLMIDSFMFFKDSYYDAIEDAKSELKAEANFRTFTLISLQPVRQVLLRELIYILDLGKTLENPDPMHMSRTLAEAVHFGGEYHIYILKKEADSLFKVVASSMFSDINSYFISYQQLTKVFEEGEGAFIRYEYSEERNEFIPNIYIARAIKSDQTNEPIGIILVTANVEEEINAILKKSLVIQNVDYAILNADSIVFASTDPQLHGQYFEPISLARRQHIIATEQIGVNQLASEPLPVIKTKDPPFFEFIFKDQVQIAYRSSLSIGGISVMGYSSKQVFFGSAVRHFLLIYTIYGLILVIGGGVTYWLSLWISRPLRQLTQTMEQVSQGNLDVRFKEEPLGFEINILGRMFNNTLDILLENIQKAQDERVKKETYQKELEIARQVQKSLLPHQKPEIEGAEFAGHYVPAKDVGGDFFGYRPKEINSGEKVVMFVVADAADRGISSCLYSFSLRSLIRSYSTLSDDIGEIISLANNAFIQGTGETGMFVTLFYAMYHSITRELEYYSCGHVPVFIKRKDGNIITLKTSGIAVGLEEAKPYKHDKISLLSGDLGIVYTSGLIEVKNVEGEVFSIARVKNLLQNSNWKSAQEAVDSLIAEVQRFSPSLTQEEEIIVMAFRIF